MVEGGGLVWWRAAANGSPSRTKDRKDFKDTERGASTGFGGPPAGGP
jgi:hypothetical protein